MSRLGGRNRTTSGLERRYPTNDNSRLSPNAELLISSPINSISCFSANILWVGT